MLGRRLLLRRRRSSSTSADSASSGSHQNLSLSRSMGLSRRPPAGRRQVRPQTDRQPPAASRPADSLQSGDRDHDVSDGHRLPPMGAATGGMAGTCPPGSKFRGDIPPAITIFKEICMHICQNFLIFQYFRNKVAEIRGEIGI